MINETYIKETLGIINALTFNNDKEKAILLNSLLALVVLPFEKTKKNGDKVFPGEFSKFKKNNSIMLLRFQPIKTCNCDAILYNKRTIYSFIKKFRNGVAHQNIAYVNYDGVRIFNRLIDNKCAKCKQHVCIGKGLNPDKNGTIDFDIVLTYQQICDLAKYIAKQYLQYI